MSNSPSPSRFKIPHSARSSFAMLGFGLMLLAFLIAIDRPQWFVLRPASGTAAALANASTKPVDTHQTARVGPAMTDTNP